ncbi:Uncharacterized protein DBV15_00604 [Temnothorax longispinosus]|uniref:Uncharacterized protein n=1 Tax=Temnothorax longispinosus TaxID=300112 RepID=A0A4S2KSK6_9HYME|nr:Uncharacterized protein DBV15_00604 [Temnothorax longispinosus]
MSFLPRACRATTSLSAALELTVLSFVAHPSCASAQKILLQSPGSLRRESRCPTNTNGGDRAAEGTLSSTGILSSSYINATINLAESKVNTADNQYENERYVCSDHLASLRFFPRPPAPSRGLSPLTRCPFRDQTARDRSGDTPRIQDWSCGGLDYPTTSRSSRLSPTIGSAPPPGIASVVR